MAIWSSLPERPDSLRAVPSPTTPYYGLTVPVRRSADRVALPAAGVGVPKDAGPNVGALLFLFGGVDLGGGGRGDGGGRGLPPPGAASVVTAVAAWSLTWIGWMIQEATFGIGISLEWAFWSKPRSSG